MKGPPSPQGDYFRDSDQDTLLGKKSACEEKILNKSMIQKGRAFLKVHDVEKEVSKNTPNSPPGSYPVSAHFKRSCTKKTE